MVVSGIAEHHADLHPDLVDEDHDGARARDDRGQLAQRLRHQARLQTHLRLAHLAFDFRARHQRRDRIDYEHVDRARLHERLRDFERLLAVVGLRDEKVFDLDAEFARVARIERVFRIDEGADAALLLRLGDAFEREGGFARRLGAVDLDHAAARQTADAEREVEPERAGRDDRDVGDDRLLAQLHDRALAELFLDLAQRQVERLAFDLNRHRTPLRKIIRLLC